MIFSPPLGLQLLRSSDDFPPTPPDGDRGKDEGDEDRLEGGGDDGDGPD